MTPSHPISHRRNGHRLLHSAFASTVFAALLPLLVHHRLSSSFHCAAAAAIGGDTCGGDGGTTCDAAQDSEDPHLRRLEIDLGDGSDNIDDIEGQGGGSVTEVFYAYIQPDVSTFYGEEVGSRTARTPSFRGQTGKFVNMSPERLVLYLDRGPHLPAALVGSCDSFGSCGATTFPGRTYFLALPDDDPVERVATFHTVAGQTVHYYDPFLTGGGDDDDGGGGGGADGGDANRTAGDAARRRERRDLSSLPWDQRRRYDRQRRTKTFASKYREVTGRDYLGVLPSADTGMSNRPANHMWAADRFGREHWIVTKETHFMKMPPEEELGWIKPRTDDEAPSLPEYRVADPALNLTLRVLSCAPRVFEIPRFLGPVELRHLLDLAAARDLGRSIVGQGSGSGRTSTNAWIKREESPIVDAIYRRAADLLRTEQRVMGRKHVAEPLQLVHYGRGQWYDAHHDFGYMKQRYEGYEERFATLLLYLNGAGGDDDEELVGGETSFPRWVNAETTRPHLVKPEAGKAILFYSQLPDGNLDDLSQHAALRVRKGEKWLVNLWVHSYR